MEQMTVKEIVEATGGTLLCGDEAVPLVHISIDSQSIKGGELFVPLIGERVNAHRFIGQAFEKGAAAVLTSGHDAMEDEHPWIRVEDTRKALQAIGSYYRNRLTLPLGCLRHRATITARWEFRLLCRRLPLRMRSEYWSWG